MDTFVNQLVYFGYFQSIFLLLIYLFSPKNRKNINGFIAFFVLILMVGLTGRVLHISNLWGFSSRWVFVSEFATLLFGPTIYLFTRSSLLAQHFKAKDLLHYLPSLVFNVFVLILIVLPSEELLRERNASGTQYQIVLLLVGIGLAVNISYWILSLRLFLRFRRDIQSELSFAIKSRFFLLFLLAIGLCLLSWLTLYGLGLSGILGLNRTTWQVIWLSLALTILFIAYYGMREPELFRIPTKTGKKKYTRSKYSGKKLEALQLRLEQLMEEKKPYLNRKLLKAELAEMLGVSNPEIARLLNEKIGMNFFEYVNYYRIKEFVALAKTDKAKSLTLFGLAQEAGFNSKTTFNKAFKELMGTTPRAYFSQERS